MLFKALLLRFEKAGRRKKEYLLWDQRKNNDKCGMETAKNLTPFRCTGG